MSLINHPESLQFGLITPWNYVLIIVHGSFWFNFVLTWTFFRVTLKYNCFLQTFPFCLRDVPVQIDGDGPFWPDKSKRADTAVHQQQQHPGSRKSVVSQITPIQNTQQHEHLTEEIVVCCGCFWDDCFAIYREKLNNSNKKYHKHVTRVLFE